MGQGAYLCSHLLHKTRIFLYGFRRFRTEILRSSYYGKVQTHGRHHLSHTIVQFSCDPPPFLVLHLEQTPRKVTKKLRLFHLIADQLCSFRFGLLTFGNNSSQTQTRTGQHGEVDLQQSGVLKGRILRERSRTELILLRCDCGYDQKCHLGPDHAKAYCGPNHKWEYAKGKHVMFYFTQQAIIEAHQTRKCKSQNQDHQFRYSTMVHWTEGRER